MSLQDERLKRELNFLVLKFLKQPGFEETFESFTKCLLNDINNDPELPSTSAGRSQSSSKQQQLQNLIDEYSHITPSYLLETLRAVKHSVNNGPAPGLITVLGHSLYSLPALIAGTADSKSATSKPISSNNLVVNLSKRHYGLTNLKSVVARKTAKSPALVTRILGHLAPIYCIVIDQTGTVAFTGADDGLVKGWSLDRYFLLTTLRGHKKEISDLSINNANTMLASGSCDKEVRIWCLQTSRTLTVLTGHRATINSLHFSPNGDYMTTSSSDGLVCFWPITGPKSVCDDPIPFYEKVRTADKLLSSGFSAGGTVLAVGSSDGDIFTYTLRGKLGLPKKDQTLEGHSAMVITLTFARRSMSFVSGSKDGTVRIWTRSGGTWDHVICNAKTHVVPDRDPKEQIDVLLAQWSSNEARVLGSCSDTSLRMWDLHGNLIQVFLGHDDEVYFVQEHPLVSNVLVSCGHDGHIITWSMESGMAISTFLNVIEGEGRASVLEATFTPDGESMLTVDANGHVTVFGHQLLNVSVPREQFFSTDYISLIRDRFSNVLDEQAEVPPHLVGPPYMVDQQGMALPPEIQGLIPGRHFLSPADAALLKKKNKTKKKLDFVLSTITPRERILSSERPTDADSENIPELADFQRSFVVPADGEEEPDYEHIPAVVPPMSSYDLFDGVMAHSIAMISSEQSRKLWLNRKIVPLLSELQLNKAAQNLRREEELDKLGEVEVKVLGDRPRKSRRSSPGKKPARLTRQSRPVREERSSSEETVSTEEEVEEDANSSDVDWKASEIKQRRTPVKKEHEPDDQDSYEESEEGGSSAIKREHSTDETHDSGEESPTTPKTTNSRKRRCVRVSIISSDETLLSPEVLTSVRKPKRRVPARERALKKVRRLLRSTKPSQSATHNVTSETEDAATTELIEQYKPPRWVTQIQPVRSPYLPQISDKIYYFVQGHLDYVNSEHCIPESSNIRPWEQREFGYAQLCQVLSLSFITGPPTLCQIKLGLLDCSGNVEDTFFFRYHDAPNIPDFMVLKRHYEDSMNHKWLKDDKFRSLIDNAWWEGSVHSTSALDDGEYPNSPWKRICVKWDNEPDTERLSAWDIEPLPKDKRSAKRRSPTKKHSSHQSSEFPGSSRQQQFNFGAQNPVSGPLDPYILSYYHTHGNWGSDETREEFLERFGNALLEIMEMSEAPEFLYPVNFGEHPDYYAIVAYPLDLTTIHNRLTENHYRSIESVLWEVRQLEINARVYNEDASDIVHNVTHLVTRITIFIKNPAFKNIKTQITSEMVVEELENRLKSKKRKRRLRVRSADKTEWYERASSVLEKLISHSDSHPFINPVDLTIYSDYLKYCQEPMDLETITDKLQGGSYALEIEFYKDIDLMFTNSFNYNTLKTSTISKITTRLKEYYDSLIDQLAADDIIDIYNDSFTVVTPNNPYRAKTAIPLELVVPKGNIPCRSRRSSSIRSNKSSKGKEPVSKTIRPRIYTTSSSEGTSDEEEVSPVSGPGSRVSSKRESPVVSRVEEAKPVIFSSDVSTQSSNSSSGEEERSSGTSDKNKQADGKRSMRVRAKKPLIEEKRARRTKNRVNYQHFDHSFSEQSSDADFSKDEAPSIKRKSNGKGSVSNGNKDELHRSKNGKVSKTSERDSSDDSETGKVLRKRKEKYLEDSSDNEVVERANVHSGSSDENESGTQSESDGEGSGSSNGKVRTRSNRVSKSKSKKDTITTKRGRSVKKNVRYDDFF